MEGRRKSVVGVMRLERRIAKRFATSLEIVFVWRGQTQRATAVDVSMTGMRLEAEVDLEAATDLEVHFSAPSHRTVYRLGGRIAWSTPSNEIAGLYSSGLEFRGIAADVEQALGELIRQLGGEDTADDLPLVADEHVIDVKEDKQPAVAGGSTDRLAASSGPAGRDGRAQQITDSMPDGGDDDPRHRQANRSRADELVEQAHAAQRAGDLEKQVALLDQAVGLVPDVPELVEELASAVYLMGDVRASAQLFDKALRIRLQRGG